MHNISMFFDKLFIIVLKLSIIIAILLAGYASFILLNNSQKEPVALKITITDKFIEDNGFIIFNQDITTKKDANKIRVEFLDKNNIDTNIFTIHKSDYEKIEVGKTYWAKFKNNNLGYINFDAEVK